MNPVQLVRLSQVPAPLQGTIVAIDVSEGGPRFVPGSRSPFWNP